MFLTALKKYFGKGKSSKVRARRTYRPELLVLEDRLAPASMTWVGPMNGNWSVAANWSGGQVPGNGDTVIFDGTQKIGANTNSIMDLGGGVQYHIGKLQIFNSYTGAITLMSNLFVDVLEMDGGTIDGTGYLDIYQRTDNQQVGPATIFATSFWTRGTIQTNLFLIEGEANHQATLQVGMLGATATLNTNMTLRNQFTTVNWTAGNVEVAAATTLTNNGTFFADGGGRWGNTLGPASSWTFQNNRVLILGRGRFTNSDYREGPNGRRIGGMGALGPGSFEIAGSSSQDEPNTLTSIESGTLLISGPFSQTKGDLTLWADTLLTVTGDFTESADANFNIELTTPSSGSGLLTVGGTVSLNGSSLNVTALSGFSGDQFTLIENTGAGAVVGTFAGLLEGAPVVISGYSGPDFYISYKGGDGNDVVLLDTPPDTTPPSVSLTTTAGDPLNGPFSVTATFSEEVAGFTLADVIVGNGTASNLQEVAPGLFNFDVTPTADGPVTVDVPAGAAQDVAGNNNTAAQQLTRTYDGTAPTAALSSSASDPVYGPFSVTVTFSEVVTGFALDDVIVGNGTAGNLQEVTPGTVYTIDVTPTGPGLVTVDVAAGAAQDAAGNHSQAANQLTRTYYLGGSIGDFVFNDANNNGIQDAGDGVMAGVTVNLLDELGGWLASTTTDASGHYLFTGLAAGNYQIQVVAPTGYVFSPQNQGSDDALDSDVDSSGYSGVFSLSLNENRDDLDAGLFFNGGSGSGS